MCDYPAIGTGTAYRYYISGGRLAKGKARVALPPLRRWAVADISLREWLNKALQELSPSDPAAKSFAKLSSRFQSLSSVAAARAQVANFYKKWFDKIAAADPKGRGLALYQDLSSAFVLGRQLRDVRLPASEAPGRDPARVAQQLMVNCL